MLLFLHKIQHLLYTYKVPLIPKLIKGGIFLIFGCVLPPQVVIGSGTRLWHHGLGIILHPGVIIGKNCNIYNHVLLGGGHDGPDGPPVKIIVEDNVNIGSGARILCKNSPLVLREGTTVAANAVVMFDTVKGEVVAGVPATHVKVKSRYADG
ncbi:serine acetyltransferase [Pseudodesulfovibrio sp. zrk46]|uniref:serine acetyltransferase n=1 Tax=Pseudodesulfovibrio sp. zrk46 TaxID=2725288 RepID=UPI001448A693|nr:serine acetyltransferase [Pseudodesulfovibrio sp. zrk46]QJB57401.1 serine acetyltransferase [Pseudodesulfovibrio sp. zrk46]